MKLKKAIIQVMSRDDLKAVVDSLELTTVDRRDRTSMAKSVGKRREVGAEFLLGFLSEAQVKEVCEKLGVDPTGRKNALVERLLAEEDQAPEEDAGEGEEEEEVEVETAEEAPKRGPGRPARAKPAEKATSGATLGFETTLWKAADKLRNNLDAAEYKHVVLGLIFLKYISDAFDERHAQLEAEKAQGADPEDRDEYLGENVFWVPKQARWAFLQANAKQPTIGKLIDDAMTAIERDNETLRGVLLKDYARPQLDKQRLGELIDLLGTIGLGDRENRSKDILGRVYEYFLGQFASAEGKKGGQFYTPRCVVQTLVAMLAPYKGRVYDPCCGSGGMFVQSEKFVEAHGGKLGDISIYGQESNPTTWRLAKMNLAIRSIDANLGKQWADSFHHDQHPDLKADYVLANPPFNSSDWGGERLREDVRWKYGAPPAGNANFGWVQHFVHHLAPTGLAGFVLANGSMSSQQSGEGEIRKSLVEGDMVDCMVALPGQLFYSTQIPVCLWFLSRDKRNGLGGKGKKMRNRSGETLFIDARKLGTMIDRVHRELTEADIDRIAGTYHAWRGDGDGKYADVAGFCKSVKNEEIAGHQLWRRPLDDRVASRLVDADQKSMS